VGREKEKREMRRAMTMKMAHKRDPMRKMKRNHVHQTRTEKTVC
jgi:hypothetical protein